MCYGSKRVGYITYDSGQNSTLERPAREKETWIKEFDFGKDALLWR